jgi:hypothetical protein
MICPWHHSRLFWLGLPVAAALLWGWLAFPLGSTLLGWRSGGREIWFGDQSGVLVLEVWEDGRRSRQGFHDEANPHDLGLASEDTRFFPPAVRRSAHHVEDFRVKSLSISHGLVLPLYLVVWLSILGAWQRRKGRSDLMGFRIAVPGTQKRHSVLIPRGD